MSGIFREEIDKLQKSLQEVYKQNEWKRLITDARSEQSVTLPNSFNELYIEVAITGTSDIISANIPRTALSSTKKVFKIGSYFTSSVNTGVVLNVSTSDVHFRDSYQNGTYTANARMAVYYK